MLASEKLKQLLGLKYSGSYISHNAPEIFFDFDL